jgi:uncharacterized protein YbbC (DUF1343 family)
MKNLIALLIVALISCGCASNGASRDAATAPADVLTGADVLKRDNYKLLQGKRVALVTNHTGRDREGNRLVDLLAAAPNVKLVKLFSPEHGLYGQLDEKVKNTSDPKTKLPVFSLYGETRKPSKEMLDGVDVIVYDLQDVGARFYTYISTLGLCIEAAAANKVGIVVLDRPCPITGEIVDGPIADPDKLSFTAYRRIPVAHGMTVGELAQLFNDEHKADLTVVRIENWQRDQWWDETGLTWVNPSPNMRNLTQALLYPGICLLESSNTSVGRGTDQPFEIFGAPWIDGRKLAAALNASGLRGVRFVPVEFTPTASKHKGVACQGCYVIVTDRETIQPVRVGTTIVWHLHQLFGEKFEFDRVNTLLKNDTTLAAIKSARDPEEIARTWKADEDEWRKTREKFLIYR